jgi:hypothetical protein
MADAAKKQKDLNPDKLNADALHTLTAPNLT